MQGTEEYNLENHQQKDTENRLKFQQAVNQGLSIGKENQKIRFKDQEYGCVHHNPQNHCHSHQINYGASQTNYSHHGHHHHHIQNEQQDQNKQINQQNQPIQQQQYLTATYAIPQMQQTVNSNVSNKKHSYTNQQTQEYVETRNPQVVVVGKTKIYNDQENQDSNTRLDKEINNLKAQYQTLKESNKQVKSSKVKEKERPKKVKQIEHYIPAKKQNIEVKVEKGIDKKIIKRIAQLEVENNDFATKYKEVKYQNNLLLNQIDDLKGLLQQNNIKLQSTNRQKEEAILELERYKIRNRQLNDELSYLQSKVINGGEIVYKDKIIEKIVEKPVEKIVEVEKIVYKEGQTKEIEVPIVQEQVRVIEVPKEIPVPVEKIVHIPVEKTVEVIKEVPVDKIIEKIVEKPIFTEKIVEVPVEKIVEIPVDRWRDRVIEVPVEKIVEVPVDRWRDRHVPVEKIVEKIVEVPVDRVVEVPDKVREKENIQEIQRLQSLLEQQYDIQDRFKQDVMRLQNERDDFRNKLQELYDNTEQIATENTYKNRELLQHIQYLEQETKILENKNQQLTDTQKAQFSQQIQSQPQSVLQRISQVPVQTVQTVQPVVTQFVQPVQTTTYYTQQRPSNTMVPQNAQQIQNSRLQASQSPVQQNQQVFSLPKPNANASFNNIILSDNKINPTQFLKSQDNYTTNSQNIASNTQQTPTNVFQNSQQMYRDQFYKNSMIGNQVVQNQPRSLSPQIQQQFSFKPEWGQIKDQKNIQKY